LAENVRIPSYRREGV